LGPSGSPSTRNSDRDEDEPTAVALQKPVRRASLTERLRPFVDEMSANEIAYPSKADRPWKYIVMHHSAAPEGCYDQIDREHRKVLGFDGCGYHFVIGNGTGSGDGQIEVAMRWNNQKQGVHCRNAKTHDADEYGIGICLIGDFDQQPPTPRQVAAASALVAYLSQRYKIAPSRVTTHAHLAATPTVCPGKYFPSQALAAAAKDEDGRRAIRTTWTSTSDAAPRSN
jgi:N-acetyl-anhydromuramyl-L-alanine amidase AmpD